MKTKERILEAALTHFNRFGWVNVTLRDVSASLNLSYGNVTYHFATKEKLLEAIYAAYHNALVDLSQQLSSGAADLLQLLAAPQATFAISLKYRFLFVDFLELQRQYPAFMAEVNAAHKMRKAHWKAQLVALQDQGVLRADITAVSFDFIMELSGLVRTFFFLKVTDENQEPGVLEAQYVEEVNAVLWPYLSEKGLAMAKEAGYYGNLSC